jgi:hypothetical protein
MRLFLVGTIQTHPTEIKANANVAYHPRTLLNRAEVVWAVVVTETCSDEFPGPLTTVEDGETTQLDSVAVVEHE